VTYKTVKDIICHMDKTARERGVKWMDSTMLLYALRWPEREADRQRGWTDYTPPQPEWKPEPKPATPDITDHDGPRSVSEADWLEFNTEANDYGVPDRAGLQSVIDVIGEHYLHLAREWGWNDTEVRDAMYVETKQRGWCRE